MSSLPASDAGREIGHSPCIYVRCRSLRISPDGFGIKKDLFAGKNTWQQRLRLRAKTPL
jgi:hypothetical protein